MATIPASAIQTRIREVLLSAASSLRTIPLDTYDGGQPEGDGDMERARAAVTGPKIEALCVGMSRNPSSPPTLGNIFLYDSQWRIRVIRTLDRTTQISDSERDAIKALAFWDADVLRGALSFPGNLSTTAAGTATQIVSGLMTYVDSSSSAIRGLVDEGAQTIETDHNFTAILRSTPAVS